VRKLVGGGRDLRADDVEHRWRIPKPEAGIQKGFATDEHSLSCDLHKQANHGKKYENDNISIRET
jgi:hypothetical protein